MTFCFSLSSHRQPFRIWVFMFSSALLTYNIRFVSVFSSFMDALLQHVKRSIYQAGIWATSDDHQQNTPSPDTFGWKKEDGCWVPVWLTIPEVSRSCQELVKCSCKAQCLRCKCAKASLPCTDLCKCKCSEWLISNNHSTQIRSHNSIQYTSNRPRWYVLQTKHQNEKLGNHPILWNVY